MVDEELLKKIYVDKNVGFYPDTPNKDASLTRWQLESEDILENLEHDLRGERWFVDKTGHGSWNKEDETHEPFLNEKGVKAIINILKPIVNKNTFLTNYSEERVNDLLFFISNKITRTLYCNYDEFEIKPEFFPILNEMIQTFLESSLRRPQEQGERKFLSSTEQRRILVQEGQSQKKFGLFGGAK